MTERSIFPNNVEVRQRDLAYTESTKGQQLRQRLLDLSGSLGGGRASGLLVRVDTSDSTRVQVTPGRGYTPNGEQVALETGVNQIPLADYTENVENLVYAMYTEIETTPAPQEFGGAARTTRVEAVTTIEVFTSSTFALLPGTSDDPTQFAQNRALLLGRVRGPNSGGNLPANLSGTDVEPAQSPFDDDGRIFKADIDGTLPGVTAVRVSSTTTPQRYGTTDQLPAQLVMTTTATDSTTRTTTLTYRSPAFNDSAGTPVDVTGGASNTAITSTLGFSVFVDVDRDFLPESDYTETATVIISELEPDLGADKNLRGELFPDNSIPADFPEGGLRRFEHLRVRGSAGLPEIPRVAIDVRDGDYTLLLASDVAFTNFEEIRHYHGQTEAGTNNRLGYFPVLNARWNEEFTNWTPDRSGVNSVRTGLRDGRFSVEFHSNAAAAPFGDADWEQLASFGSSGATPSVAIGNAGAPTDVIGSTVTLSSPSITLSSTGSVVASSASADIQTTGLMELASTGSSVTVDASANVELDAGTNIEFNADDELFAVSNNGAVFGSATGTTYIGHDPLGGPRGTFTGVNTFVESGLISLRADTSGVRVGGTQTNVGFTHIYEVLVTASFSSTSVNTAAAAENVTSQVPAGAPSFNETNGVVLGFRALSVSPGTNPTGGFYTSSVLITGTNTLTVILQAFDSSQSFSAGTWEGEVIIGVVA